MKVIKKEEEKGLNIYFKTDNKCLSFVFGGNGDLYWTIHNMNIKENMEYNYDYFIINKENYNVYKLFEQLFFDIENINLFDEIDIPFYLETYEEKKEYLEKKKCEKEEMKKRYRLYNDSNYNELYDKNNRTITWYSDETAHEVSSILKIKQEEDSFKIEIFHQPHKNGYDEDLYINGFIPIRIRNSGSYYDPFNIIFMRMYNNMYVLDDVNDFGHQIHIEEYLNNKRYVNKKN